MSTITATSMTWDGQLIDLLVSGGALAFEDAKAVLRDAGERGIAASIVLDERGVVDSATSMRLLASATGLEVVDLDAAPADDRAVAALRPDLSRAFHAIGYRFDGPVLLIARARPFDDAEWQELTSTLPGIPLRCVLTDERHVERLLQELVLSSQVGADAEHSISSTSSAPGPLESNFESIDELLRRAVAIGASDVHLAADLPPAVRVDGAIRPIEGTQALRPEQLHAMLEKILPSDQIEQFDAAMELDTSYELQGVGRFRVSVLRQRGHAGAVMRLIPHEVPDFDSLGLPPSLLQLTHLRRGLVLVTGPTGSGKSTTLAALIARINATKPLHIVTIEDPIEYVHHSVSAIINQREVGRDTKSFSEALRHALRQDPDVILVGEMRDLETISIALTAAETGHLVFSTLHTRGAPESVDRIVDVFPSSQQPQIRTQLASSLEAVVAQQLVLGASGSGRVPVAEVMLCNSAVRNLIRSGKTHQIYSVMQTGGDAGMQTMDMALARAVQSGLISSSVALDRAHHPDELSDYLRH